VEESQGLLLAQYLSEKGVRVVVYDPAAMDNARKVLGSGVTFARSMEQCAAEAHVLVVTTPWEQFRSLQPAHLRRSPEVPVILDCWRILRPEDFAMTARYLTLGLGARGQAGAAEE
jgi:UDPglucose 6-dehydrogenase